jgi:epsilon-lactone hydrolase
MPSFRSHLLAFAATRARLRDRQFDPDRFTVATPPDPSRFAPSLRHRRRVQIDEWSFEGWPVFTLTPLGGGRRGQVLYLHGGAHAVEIQRAHWSFAVELAVRTDRTVTVPIYPLVPAATHRDVHPALRRLYTRLPSNDPVAVMGDSAGATLALALVAGLPPAVARPRDLVLLSPVLDLALDNPEIPLFARQDPLLRADHLRELGHRFAGGDALDDPQLSPINGPLDHLGIVTLFTGTRDLLNPDARRLFDLAATSAGTTATLHEFPGMVHDWMLLPVPEARTVMHMLAKLLRTEATASVG